MRRSDTGSGVLVLHIGLPKTATTYLQHSLFPGAVGLTYVHRTHSDAARDICTDLRGLAHASPLLWRLSLLRLGRRIGALGAPGTLLISEENASLAAGGFWRGQGRGPDRLAPRLAALARRLGRPLRVIVGIRRQDQWLASRYAESSRIFAQFDQADFDRRMTEIAGSDTLPGPLAWLDFAHVADTLGATLGPENVLLVPMERLRRDPSGVRSALAAFIGATDLAPVPPGPGRRRGGRKANQLSRGENLWRMRSDGSALTLVPDVQAALRARFAASNARLDVRTGLTFPD